jgi:hypothetical protein
MNPYSRLIPRLNGGEIEGRFSYYLGLVKKDVAGFIIFGGELETVRAGVRELQNAAQHPLIIASDLEQGLGQQIEGGTLFPPAMAVASAIRSQKSEARRQKLLRDTFKAFAVEAKYAGINTILAPVLDINTNPDNPIIAARAFGEDPDTVSFFGCEMIHVLQQNGIAACGKHFPGHGDTETDSHISLPVIKKNLPYLEKNEFVPFKRAVSEGVSMIMLGHLSVPALDPAGIPASLSGRAVSYLRDGMGFRGLIITDAMNMGGIGQYSENEASLMALSAGVDIILHPSDPDAVATYLREKDCRLDPLQIPPHPPLLKWGADIPPDFASHQKLSDELAVMAVTVEGGHNLKIEHPFLISLKEDKSAEDEYLRNALKKRYGDLKYCALYPEDEIPWSLIPAGFDLLVCVFSGTRAWKGRPVSWLRTTIESLVTRARIFVSFGNPYVIRSLRDVTGIYAYWNVGSAQEAVAEKLSA